MTSKYHQNVSKNRDFYLGVANEREHHVRRPPVPTPRNINVNLGFFTRRFSTVTDRVSGSWCRFPESGRQDGENSETMGEKRGKMGEKWPKKSGGKLT